MSDPDCPSSSSSSRQYLSLLELSQIYYKTRVNWSAQLKRECFERLLEQSKLGNVNADLFILCIYCRGSNNFIEIDIPKAKEICQSEIIKSILDVYIESDEEEEVEDDVSDATGCDSEEVKNYIKYISYIRGVFFDDVLKNLEQGCRWFRKSAKLGYTFGQCSYGYCCDEGRGCVEDKTEAVRYLIWVSVAWET